MFLLLGLFLFVTFAAGNGKKRQHSYCQLCHEYSHDFQDHIIKGNAEEVKTIIEHYFDNLSSKTPTHRYFDMIETFLANDVNHVLKLPKFQSTGKDFLIDVFKYLLIIYRNKWNPSLKHLDGKIARMQNAIDEIGYEDLRIGFKDILAEEFHREPSKRKRALPEEGSSGFKYKAPRELFCLLCPDKCDHRFVKHVKDFNRIVGRSASKRFSAACVSSHTQSSRGSEEICY